ncbi:hypothetical protein [Planococcus sp. NCCP-2050]|uniref:hypothetical protein n=1 Tax=Planococcus sp. NCCP-2050 TaxID=2944679 RepID=UPI00203EA4BC|nr:hypothetical protein [Planococcus sp. NCCP-2050]GKW46941.1 hypothetical protein NCCP2050_26330 [Planococcus sp. NCCP-2050]
MNAKRKTALFAFGFGIIVILFILPLLSTIGIPSFDEVLTSLFGEKSIWAVVFSLLGILLISLGIGKIIKNAK